MNQLSNDQKEKIWDEIDEVVAGAGDIHPNERTALMFSKEQNISVKRARRILNRLEEAGILQSRRIYGRLGKPKSYYPVKDVDIENIIEELKNVESTS